MAQVAAQWDERLNAIKRLAETAPREDQTLAASSASNHGTTPPMPDSCSIGALPAGAAARSRRDTATSPYASVLNLRKRL